MSQRGPEYASVAVRAKVGVTESHRELEREKGRDPVRARESQ